MKTMLTTATALTLFATAALAEGTPGSGFIRNWDDDGDGAVTLEEVAMKRENVFYTFDENEDGVLSAEEYAVFDEARAADQANEGGNRGGGHGKASKGMTLAFNDVDGDGAVSFEEFVGQSEAWFEILDRNGDGVVTTEDFGPM